MATGLISDSELLVIVKERLDASLRHSLKARATADASINQKGNYEEPEDVTDDGDHRQVREQRGRDTREEAYDEDTDVRQDSLQNEREEDNSAEEVDDDDEDEVEDDEDEDGIDLELTDLGITDVSSDVMQLLVNYKLTRLSFANNLLADLPKSTFHLSNLLYLNISNNRLATFPTVITRLPNLKILDISKNLITSFPTSFANSPLSQVLEILSMSNNNISTIPRSIADLELLHVLELDKSLITRDMPSEVQERGSDWVYALKDYLLEHIPQPTFDLDPMQLASSTMNELKRKENEKSLPHANERLRSNSESTLSGSAAVRAAKRMGVVLAKKVPFDPKELLATSATHHVRGLSHDSVLAESLQQPTFRTSQEQDSQSGGLQVKRMSTLAEMDAPQTGASAQDLKGSVHENSKEWLSETTSAKNADKSEFQVNKSNTKATESEQASIKPGELLDKFDKELINRADRGGEWKRHLSATEIRDVAENCLFTMNELLQMIRRILHVCRDKTVTSKVGVLMTPLKASFDDLIKLLEDGVSSSVISQSITSCLMMFSNLLSCMLSYSDKITGQTDVRFVRLLILQSIGTLHELRNALSVLSSAQSIKTNYRGGAIASRSGSTSGVAHGELAASDARLYELIETSTAKAQSVLNMLTNAVNESAKATAFAVAGGGTASHTLSNHVKELTAASVMGLDATRRLRKVMEDRRSTGDTDRRRFWDSLSAFLKSVISILVAAKGSMSDLPFLQQMTPALSSLSSMTKEIPSLVEASSYKILLAESQPLHHMSTAANSTSSITSNIAPPTTPLVAALGPAHAVVSPSVNAQFPAGYSPFIPAD